MEDIEEVAMVELAVVCCGSDLEDATYGERAHAMRVCLHEMGAEIVRKRPEIE